MDDLIIVLKLLFGFAAVGILCCTVLSWHWWVHMMDSKWIDKEKEEYNNDGRHGSYHDISEQEEV